MDVKILEKIGLSKGEVLVYVTTLKKGLSQAGIIIKETKLQSSTVYHILDSLLSKGIILYEIKNKRKHFYATSPESLLDYIEDKEKKLSEEKENIKKLIPKLSKLQEVVITLDQETLIFEE